MSLRAGEPTPLAASSLAGPSQTSSYNNYDELKRQITLQDFAKSFGTSDGKS